jgi:1,4-alpha-glucan branching enzyme
VTRTDYVFYYKNRNAREVYLVGDFNNWNPYSHPLRKNRSGLWEVVLDIPPGSYLYRFIVDGVYKPDPLNKDLVKDRSDNAYSSLKLPL